VSTVTGSRPAKRILLVTAAAVVAVVVIAALTVGGGSHPGGTARVSASSPQPAPTTQSPTTPAPTVTSRTIAAALHSMSANNGDANPTDAHYVRSTENRAAQLAFNSGTGSGPDTSADPPVVLIAARGRFTGAMAKVPSGHAAPKGTVILLILTADTGVVTDWGISSRYPDLASLGPVSAV
jgi:hypothetical protein